MQEVMNHAQALSGRRIMLMPLTRRSSVVVMKFNAPSNWPTQKIAIEVAHRTTPGLRPDPPTEPNALSGAYWVQPPSVGPSLTKKDATRTRKPTKVTQNDIMLKCGKRHVLRAHLDGQEIVAKGGEGRCGEHKEDHDGAMHGHQLQIVLGSHYVAGRAILRKQLQSGNRGIGPAQVDAHQPGKKHSNQSREPGPKRNTACR